MKVYKSFKVYGLTTPRPWYSDDNPFNEIFIDRKEYILNHVSIDKKFQTQYHFDNHGFRKSHTLDDSKLWFFGCSHTFGETLEYNNCFSKIVSEQLNQSFYNFGTPGASINLIAKLLFKLRNKLKNKKIIILLPHYSRFETIADKSFLGLHSNFTSYNDFLPIKNLDGFLEYNTLQSVMLIKSLVEDSQITVMSNYKTNFINELNPVNIEQCIVDVSWDQQHYGIETNKNIANVILDHIKS